MQPSSTVRTGGGVAVYTALPVCVCVCVCVYRQKGTDLHRVPLTDGNSEGIVMSHVDMPKMSGDITMP